MGKIMEQKKVSRMLRRRIDEIYEETGSKVRVNGKMPGNFHATMTLRQRCLSSPTLFSTSTADLEKKLRRGQAGGIVIGRGKM